jgi:hypothetical protein
MVPDDELVGGKPLQTKCIHNDRVYIIYTANPDGNNPRTDNPRVESSKVNIKLPQGSYKVKWFNPREGTWNSETTISANGTHRLKTPAIGRIMYGDWIILIAKQ